MVVGVSEPLEGCEKDAVFGERVGASHHLCEQHAVGRDGKVVTMLFDCGDGEHDGCVGCESFDGGPGEVGEVHWECLV